MTPTRPPKKLLPPFLLTWAVLFGGAIRLYAAWKAGFPMVDGGMFVSMARDLQANHYLLPVFTSYNHLQIPYAYPPLGFYLLAGFNDLFHISLASLLVWLPASLSILTIPAVYLLAKALLGSDSRAGLAAAIYALTPMAFEWELQGGGLTRSLGAVFALLAVYFAIRMFREKTPGLLAATLLAGTLTVYSHPEWALQAAVACLLAWLVWGRNKWGALSALAVGGGVLALSAPWWAVVAARSGLGTFLLAAGTPQGRLFFWLPLLSMDFASAANVLAAGLAILGLFACLKEKEYFLPAWLAASFLADPRGAGHVVPVLLALLSAAALGGMVLPWLGTPQSGDRPADWTRTLSRPLVQACLGYLFLAMWIGSFTSATSLSGLNVLPAADRQALEWVRLNTPPGSRFVALAWRDSPWVSPLPEWFPALSGRASLTTVQGREWLAGKQNLTPWIEDFEAVQACLYRDAACLEAWSAEQGQPFDYVYLSMLSSLGDPDSVRVSPLFLSLSQSKDYLLVYDTPAVEIFEHSK